MTPLVVLLQQAGNFGDVALSGSEVFIIAGMLSVVIGGLSFVFQQLIAAKDRTITILYDENKELRQLLQTTARTTERTINTTERTISMTEEQLSKLLGTRNGI
jgi:hypothetical protein